MMMKPKWFSALLTPGIVALVAAGTSVPLGAERPGLRQVQTVYLMPMGYGLDQYLANRLTAEGVFEVVTDPKRADAVLTDQLGVGFERRFDELYPREKPPPPPEAGEQEPLVEAAEAAEKKSWVSFVLEAREEMPYDLDKVPT